MLSTEAELLAGLEQVVDAPVVPVGGDVSASTEELPGSDNALLADPAEVDFDPVAEDRAVIEEYAAVKHTGALVSAVFLRNGTALASVFRHVGSTWHATALYVSNLPSSYADQEPARVVEYASASATRTESGHHEVTMVAHDGERSSASYEYVAGDCVSDACAGFLVLAATFVGVFVCSRLPAGGDRCGLLAAGVGAQASSVCDFLNPPGNCLPAGTAFGKLDCGTTTCSLEASASTNGYPTSGSYLLTFFRLDGSKVYYGTGMSRLTSSIPAYSGPHASVWNAIFTSIYLECTYTGNGTVRVSSSGGGASGLVPLTMKPAVPTSSQC